MCFFFSVGEGGGGGKGGGCGLVVFWCFSEKIRLDISCESWECCPIFSKKMIITIKAFRMSPATILLSTLRLNP